MDGNKQRGGTDKVDATYMAKILDDIQKNFGTPLGITPSELTMEFKDKGGFSNFFLLKNEGKPLIHPDTNVKVGVKVFNLSKGAQQAFRDEIKIYQELFPNEQMTYDDPSPEPDPSASEKKTHLLQYIGNNDKDGIQAGCRYYILQEYCEGDSLFTFIKQQRHSDSTVLFNIYTQMCEGVLELHERNIAHMDIKPENFMISTEDTRISTSTEETRISTKLTVYIIDFNYSVKTDQDGIHEDFAGLRGTLMYMAPEISENIVQSDKLTFKPFNAKKADAWSLGVCLYVLLENTTPPFKNWGIDDPDELQLKNPYEYHILYGMIHEVGRWIDKIRINTIKSICNMEWGYKSHLYMVFMDLCVKDPEDRKHVFIPADREDDYNDDFFIFKLLLQELLGRYTPPYRFINTDENIKKIKEMGLDLEDLVYIMSDFNKLNDVKVNTVNEFLYSELIIELDEVNAIEVIQKGGYTKGGYTKGKRSNRISKRFKRFKRSRQRRSKMQKKAKGGRREPFLRRRSGRW